METNFTITRDGFYAIKTLIELIDNSENKEGSIKREAVTNSNGYTYRVLKVNDNEYSISFKSMNF